MSERATAGIAALLLVVAAARPATAGAATQQAGPVDRVVAVVNGEVITLLQLERAIELTRRLEGDPTADCTPPANESPSFSARLLECMIDDLLQFQHVRRFPQFEVLPEVIDDAFEELVGRYESHDAFEEALREQKKTADEVRYDLQREALIANYIDIRYRQIIDIGEREIRRYYEEVLRPEMERQGAEMPLLEAVDDEFIEPTLVETEVNRRVEEWIADLRRRADIVVYTW